MRKRVAPGLSWNQKGEAVFMQDPKQEEKKKATPFVVAWDMAVYGPLYALLLLAIFAGISALMIWGLEQVAWEPLIQGEIGGFLHSEEGGYA